MSDDSREVVRPASGQTRSGASPRREVASPPSAQLSWRLLMTDHVDMPRTEPTDNRLLWPGEEQHSLPVRLSDQNLRNPHAPSLCGVVAPPSLPLSSSRCLQG